MNNKVYISSREAQRLAHERDRESLLNHAANLYRGIDRRIKEAEDRLERYKEDRDTLTKKINTGTFTLNCFINKDYR